MADISMCQNKKCKPRNSCHRYTAEANEYGQSYGSFGRKDRKQCKMFMDNGMRLVEVVETVVRRAVIEVVVLRGDNAEDIARDKYDEGIWIDDNDWEVTDEGGVECNVLPIETIRERA